MLVRSPWMSTSNHATSSALALEKLAFLQRVIMFPKEIKDEQ